MIFEDIDFWRLSDRLSVTNAAMLSAGIDPGKYEFARPDKPEEGHFHVRSEGNHENYYSYSSAYIAVFAAIRSAIFGDRLAADISRLARVGDEDIPETPAEGEVHIPLNDILRTEGMSLKSNAEQISWEPNQTIVFIKEPDWTQTTIMVNDLKEWMLAQNVLPPFFFPEIRPEGFRDKGHERYSAKLAAAVAAWEVVQEADSGRTVKQTLEKWLKLNASNFGLTDDDGNPRTTAVETCAEVANWLIGGGAPKSGKAMEGLPPAEHRTISNFAVKVGPVKRVDGRK